MLTLPRSTPRDLVLIRAKRRGRQSGAVKQVSFRVVRPRVPNRGRFVYILAGNEDPVIVNPAQGGAPALVGAGDLKPLQDATPRDQATVGMAEAQLDLAARD